MKHKRQAAKILQLSRRSFFKGGAAVVGVGAAIGVLGGCKHKATNEISSKPAIIDSKKADYIIDPQTNESIYEHVDQKFAPTQSFDITLGSTPRVAQGSWIPLTMTGETASPMIVAGALNVANGEVKTTVSSLVGQKDPNVVIYNVCASDQIYAWIELNLINKSWVLYAAPFEAGALTGDAVPLWKADKNWDPPAMSAYKDALIWQVMPALSGNKTQKHSYCYIWHTGDKDATAAVESPGRFASPPAVSGDMLTLSPRVNESEGVFYGMSAYSLKDDLSTLIDRLVLPQGVKPFHAVMIDERFAFSVEATYSENNLLSQMGSYIGTQDEGFIVLAREPLAEIAEKNKNFFIKSANSYFVVDTKHKEYSTLPNPNRTLDYGAFPAREGTCDSFIDFATVKSAENGYPSHVQLRIYAL